MTFEYIIEKENKKVTLSDVQADEIAGIIEKNFDIFNNQRRENLEQAESLINKIFFKDKAKSTDVNTNVGGFSESKSKDWKSKVKMCKVYMFYQVLKAFIWKNVYANPSSMFDVSGENQEADNDSNKQKSALVDVLDKMNYAKICDQIVEYGLLYGEMITMCCWKKEFEEVRKKVSLADINNPKALKAVLGGKFHYIDEELKYDNPYIYAINPAHFVFDIAQKDNWDKCPKIYRSFKTPDEIINNKYYTISKDVADDIKALCGEPQESDSQLPKDLEHKKNNGSTVEVFEHWGDFTMPDGTVLKNWHVVCVAGHLIRFCKNKYVVNPFNYSSVINDPKTQHGISLLYCTLPLAELQEELMNRTCDMQSLAENPPIYAPKGFFKESEVELYPGKIIEFGDNLSPSEIKSMEFAVNVFLNDITFLSDLMAETSGIFPNMAGADEARAKTATEISTKAQGQLTRLSMIIDCINQNTIIPDIKKIAKLCAFFKSGVETIFVNKGNDKETIEVDDSVRQAEYRYTYADRTATTDRSNKADLVVQACKEFAQFIPLNGQELFTWYMEQKDVENPERFLQLQDVIPLEVQQMLLQDERIKAICDNFNAQKQALISKGENTAQAPVQDTSVPEAQPLE